MARIWAGKALLSDGWAENVCVDVDENGRIGAVTRNADPEGERVGILLPAPVNAHSHAFQRAMAGLTERRGPDPRDSFWTWRQLMYQFLDHLTPEHIEIITTFVQMEMLEAGYATNVEFHYIHHQPGGVVYDNLAELSERVVAATNESGIGLTLLPVHYQYGGCDKRDLGSGQIRFGNDIDRFANLFEQASKAISNLTPDCNIGLAPHSLRAVGQDDYPRLVEIAAGGPIHLHLAEQIPEVDEVSAAWGKRPVEWLLDNVDVNEDWCLIHCTQMQKHETLGLAKTGAVAGLCPITESSLGDGIFDGVRWLNADGKIAVGSDSNIKISLAEELRVLDYSQRLRDHSRAALATSEKSTGRRLFDAVCEGGAQAAKRNSGRIETGCWADLMALDNSHVDFIGRDGDILLDSFIFAGAERTVTDVWAAGRHLVHEGRHIKRDAIVGRYAKVMQELGGLL
ncbi:MAG: formimidoylglutamate deiminase [Pseudomonadota bacterium]